MYLVYNEIGESNFTSPKFTITNLRAGSYGKGLYSVKFFTLVCAVMVLVAALKDKFLQKILKFSYQIKVSNY